MANLQSIQVGWGKQWETLANAINDYYGGGVSSTQYQQIVNMLNSGEYTMDEMESILGNIPEFNRTYNANGQLTGVSYNARSMGSSAAGDIASEINSNVAMGSEAQFSTVQTITKDAQTGKVTMSDNVTKYNAGTATTAKAVASSAVAGVMAASVGITVGKIVNQAAYDHGFNWLSWAGVDMESLNPETWSDITAGDDSFGSKLFNFVFQIDPNTGNPQAYIDEQTFAYMTAYMASVGVFDGHDVPVPYEGGVGDYITVNDLWLMTAQDFVNRFIFPSAHSDRSDTELASNFFSGTYQNYINANDVGYISCTSSGNELTWSKVNPQSAERVEITSEEGGQFFSTEEFDGANGGIRAYYNYGETVSRLFGYYDSAQYTSRFTNVSEFPSTKWGTYVGSMTHEDIEGITNQTGATQFDTSGIDDYSNIAAILAALMTQFPDLWNNRIEVSPDGENIIKYIPVGFPTGGTGQMPTTNGATQSDLAPDIAGDGDNVTDELIKTLIDIIQNPKTTGGMESDTDTPTKPIDPNGTGTGTGTTPIIIIPTGSASALYSVYNPTQAQLNSFGAWLWSSNFVDQLLKLFNDPMQAIIGLHKIFATPPTSGTGNIKVGYLDSGVSSKLVSNQYTEIDCGTVKLSEYFGNVLDYTNTDVYIYLPFIGIVSLNVDDVTRADINVKYKVDVLTGACLASVNVTRDANSGGQLYVYSGNCAVQYPLSSGSYMGIVSGILGIAGSVAGTIASGGALLPMALGVGASAMNNAKTRVEHSGSLSGNAGAMGIKKPYLIIRRPQTKIAENFQTFNGESNNIYTTLSSCAGYTRVKYLHLENIPATDNELTQIEELLKSGVLI